MLDRRSMLRAVALAVAAAAANPAITRATPFVGGPTVRRPAEVLERLPGDSNQLALTFDDGTSTEVVAAFGQFCRDSGVRLTFFPNGSNPSWTDNAPLLRPMVDSGQIQLGNHTWSHPRLTDMPLDAVAEQIRRNDDFLHTTYGVDATPYFRPPFGAHNADTDRVAADLGYTTITMWSATLGEDWLPQPEERLLDFATTAFRPQQIVLGHANAPAVTHTYAQLVEIISGRGLQTVTLADVFP